VTDLPGRSISIDSTVGIIGAGRLGCSLGLAMAVAGCRVIAASTRSAERRALLSDRVAGVKVTAAPEDVAQAAQIIFITAPDSAIADVARSVRWRPEQAVVHCSGAMSLDALVPAGRQGAATGGFHPMQTFPSPDASGNLRGITFGVECGDPALSSYLGSLARILGGEIVRISAAQRAAYHTSAVMASGLMSAWAGMAADMWAQFGETRERALHALSPLIVSTSLAVARMGVPGAITGPYVRGDVDTIARHLAATAAQGGEIGRAYAALALATLPIAAEQGGLDEERRRSIESMLQDVLRDPREAPQ